MCIVSSRAARAMQRDFINSIRSHGRKWVGAALRWMPIVYYCVEGCHVVSGPAALIASLLQLVLGVLDSRLKSVCIVSKGLESGLFL